MPEGQKSRPDMYQYKSGRLRGILVISIFVSNTADKLNSQGNNSCYNCQNVSSCFHRKTSFTNQTVKITFLSV